MFFIIDLRDVLVDQNPEQYMNKNNKDKYFWDSSMVYVTLGESGAKSSRGRAFQKK